MTNNSKNAGKKRLANNLGAVGYVFCCFEWLLALIHKIYLILNYADKYLVEEAGHFAPEPMHYDVNPTIMIILAVLMSVFIIVITIYSLYKIPSAVTGTAERVVHKTNDVVCNSAIKVIQKGGTEQSRKKLSARTMLALKLLFTMGPIIICYILGPSSSDVLNFQTFTLVVLPFAMLGVLMFVCQYCIAKSIRVPFDDIC